MISVSQVGISQVPITLLQSVETETELEVAEPLLDYDGTLLDDPSESFNPMTDIQLKGKGSLPAALALVGAGADLLTAHADLSGGKVVVKSNKYVQNAKSHDEFDASATHYPNAA